MIMIVVGLLLLAVAIFVIVVSVVAGGDSLAIEVFNVDLELTTWGLFVAGVVTGVVAMVGVVATVAGSRRIHTHRREIEELRRKVAMLEGGEPRADLDKPPNGERAEQPFGQRHESDSRHARLP